MRLLPVAAREFRVASRQRRTYWSRCAIAFLATAIGAWMMVYLGQTAAQGLGRSFLSVLSGLAFLNALLAGCYFTSDCLSEEKREGTLGLLFLTDLRGYDIVAGKLTANSVNAFYGMLAVLPVLSISIVMGSVTGGEVWRLALVLMNTLLFSLAAGLFSSSLVQEARKALGLTLLILIVFSLLIPFLGWVTEMRRGSPFDMSALLTSPIFAFGTAFEAVYQRQTNAFWNSCGFTFLLSLLMILASCLLVMRGWQDRPLSSKQSRLRARWQVWCYGGQDLRRQYRRELLQINPIYWLSARSRIKGTLVWFALGLFACGWIWGAMKYRSGWEDEVNYFLTAFFLNTFIKVWFATESCRRFMEDRKSGALELLLSTPLTEKEIFQGQLLALKRQFGGPVIAVVIVEFLCMIAGVREMGGSDTATFWFWMFLFGILILLVDLLAMSWLGMWIGATARRVNQAAGAVIARIMALPWVVYIALVMIINMPGARGAGNLDEMFYLALWFGVSLAVSIGFLMSSRERLYRQLRVLATQPASVKASKR